jgi:outer membrane lipoprotein-sorting protein
MRTTTTRKWRSTTMTRTRMRRRRTRRTVRRTDGAAGPARPAARIGRIAAGVMLSAAVLLSSGTAIGADHTPARPVEAAARLIASVASRYASTPSYEIDFTQESYWALADSLQVTTGTLSVVRPGRLAIRYADGGRIVAGGDTLRVYVPATNQFFVARLDSTDVLFDPLGLLSAYAPDDVDPFGPGDAGAGGRRVVTLRPRPPAVEPARVDVEIDGASGLLRSLTAYSSGGDRTRYALRETRLGADVPDSAFRLILPPGAEIVRGTPYGG